MIDRRAVLAGGVAAAAVALSQPASADDSIQDQWTFPPPDEPTPLADAVYAAVAAIGLPADWGPFLVASAATESRLNPRLVRGVPLGAPPGSEVRYDPGEARSAARAYARRSESLPWPAARYCAGSVGAWQMQPANWAAHCGDKLDPWLMADPAWQCWGALRYAVSCMRWSNFRAQPCWANLRVCARAPKRMGEATEIERQTNGRHRLGDQIVALGFSRKWVHKRVGDRPVLPSQMPHSWRSVW